MTKYKVEDEIKEMLVAGEKVIFVAQQCRIRPGGSIVTPDKLYVTTNRIIYRDPYLLGIKKFFNEYYFKDISNIRMKKGAFSTELYLRTRFLSDEVLLPAVQHEEALEITRHIRDKIGDVDAKGAPTSINININNTGNDNAQQISAPNKNKIMQSGPSPSISKGANKSAGVLFGIDFKEDIKSIRLVEPDPDSSDILVLASTSKSYYLIDKKGKIVRQQKTEAEILSLDISLDNNLIMVVSDDIYIVNYEDNEFTPSKIQGKIENAYLSYDGDFIIGLIDDEINDLIISNIQSNARIGSRDKIVRWRSGIPEKIKKIALSKNAIYATSKNKLYYFNYSGLSTGNFSIDSPKTDDICFVDCTKQLPYNIVIIGTKKGLIYYIGLKGNMEWCKEIQGEISNISISSDGTLILVGTTSGFLYFLDEHGNDIKVYEVEGRINSIKIAYESKNVVVGANILYYFTSEGDLIWFYDTKEKVNTVDISPNGNVITIGSKSVILFDSRIERPDNPINIQRETLPDNVINLKNPVSGNNPKPSNVDSSNILSCSRCGYNVEEDWINCPKCGNPLSLKCKKCGKDIQLDWALCPYCGHSDVRKCPKCSLELKSDWVKCPKCGEGLTEERKSKSKK